MATYTKVPAEVSQVVKRKPVGQPAIAPGQPHQSISTPYTSILITSAGLILPAVILPTVLLSLVLQNIRSPSGPWFRAQYDGYLTDTSAYYVEYSSSQLLTIASWASTTAPFLATLAMMLLVFHSAKQLKRNSASRQSMLPTPYQLGLTLSGLAADLSTAWRLFMYLCFWKQRRKLSLISIDVFAILGVVWFIGYGIVAVDTWLHVTTDAVQLIIPKISSQINGSYGWSINDTTVNGGWPYPAYTSTFISFFNTSSDNRISVGQDQNRTFAYLSSPLVTADQDYRTTTIGAETTCKLVTDDCSYGDYSVTGLQFNCTWGATGYSTMGDQENTVSEVGVTTTQNGASNSWNLPPCCGPEGVKNQFDYTVWGLFAPGDGGLPSYSNLLQDMRLEAVDQYDGWFANCSTTRYILDYTLTAGQFQLNAEPKSINLSVESQLTTNYFSGRVSTLLSTANTGQELLDIYALYASQLFAASTSYFVNTTLNQAETESVIGTRIEKAPLFLLVALNYLYAIVGIFLTVLALCSNPTEVQEIVTKLNVYGIVAARFEPNRDGFPATDHEELFAEGAVTASSSGLEIPRVGFIESHRGGWKYQQS